MKKILSILLAVLLLAALGVPAFAVTDTDADIWTAELSGFEMSIPDAFRDAKGYIAFHDLGEGVNPGSGVVQAVASYIAMSIDTYNAVMEEQMDAYMSGDLEKLEETADQTDQVEWSFFTVYGINRNRGEDELRAFLTEQMNLSPDAFGGDEELAASAATVFENQQFRELGEKDGLRYFLSYYDLDTAMKAFELQGVTEPDPVYLDEYRAFLEQNDRLAECVTLTGGAVLADTAELGSKLVFDTTDLEGNPVTSEEIFTGHRITMINMWATWCEPCKDELPELAKMSKDFEKQGCQIIGICLDAEDEETMAEGSAILEDAGVEYLNIVPFEGREELLPNKLYPTTYYVDENGIVLDEVISGALLTRYPQALEKLLASLIPAETPVPESAETEAAEEQVPEAVIVDAESTEAPNSESEAPAAETEAPLVYTVKGVTYPYLLQLTDDEDPEESEMTLYFFNNGDIPYVALDEYMSFLGELLTKLDKGDVEYNVEALTDTLFIASRPDNYSAVYVDTEDDTLFFVNLNGFTQKVGQKAAVTIKALPEPEIEDLDEMAAMISMFQGLFTDLEAGADDGEALSDLDDEAFAEDDAAEPDDDDGEYTLDLPEDPQFFTTGGFSIYNRAGDTVEFKMDEYMIDLIGVDGRCYVPFQTLNDLFLSLEYIQHVFTGEKILGFAYGSEFADARFEVPTGTFSEEFALFNYNELRFLLDSYYGLKPEHNIKDFGTLLAMDTDLMLDLAGTDPRKFDLALQRLTFTYLDDGHSGYLGSSVLAGPNELDPYVTFLTLGPSGMMSMQAGEKFVKARAAVYGDAVPGYEEVGDTAFITFDSFTQKREDEEYYTAEIDPDNLQDTIELIIYANSQIKREDSPIKNIVLDLSNNNGGQASAAVCVMSWFLGDAPVALRDTLTGAQTNMIYNCDVDLDGYYDVDADTVSNGYNLYCMTSIRSFSCGNLVPAACKSSGKVTMVGQISGGGSCVVLPCTTASGALFAISSPHQLAIIKNGTFYNIDSGVDPDIVLTKAESFYNRPALADYLRAAK